MTPGVAAALLLLASPIGVAAGRPPFSLGEQIVFRVSYPHLLAGRASVRVEAGGGEGAPLRFVEEARSQGFLVWLFHFRVDDRTVAEWDPAAGCSLGTEKHLHEGRAVRDQVVRIDPVAGIANLRDPKIATTSFDVEPCVLDVLSALFVARLSGVAENGLTLPVFDNGKSYRLEVRFLGREALDLPPPLGPKTPTVIVEPQLLEGTGLFVKEGRLRIWLTDDARRVPVRMVSRVPVGAISADLESYKAGR